MTRVQPRLSSDSHFRPDIEGLRAIAILLVVLFHVGRPLSSGGFGGVDVFYVISSYLIAGLLVRELEQTGDVRLSNFYARRVRRLLPASAAMVLATVLVGYLLLSPVERLFHDRAESRRDCVGLCGAASRGAPRRRVRLVRAAASEFRDVATLDLSDLFCDANFAHRSRRT